MPGESLGGMMISAVAKRKWLFSSLPHSTQGGGAYESVRRKRHEKRGGVRARRQ